MRRAALLITAALALPIAACSSRPAGCSDVPAAQVVGLATGITAADVDASAEYHADGGTYIAAHLGDKDATVVWFQTPSGATFSVGPVTALFSRFPDSAGHTPAGVGTDGFTSAKACVE